MYEITFMKTIRTVLETAVTECTIREYKPEYIFRQFNTKLSNIRTQIDQADMNKKQKAKYYKVLDGAKLPYLKANHYELMKVDFKSRINSLPGMIQFIKK